MILNILFWGIQYLLLFTCRLIISKTDDTEIGYKNFPNDNYTNLLLYLKNKKITIIPAVAILPEDEEFIDFLFPFWSEK